MDEYLRLALARHLLGLEYYTPTTLYATLADSGSEVAGLTRVAIVPSDPYVVDSTTTAWDNESPVAFTNTPAGTADAVWVFDAASGGNRCFSGAFDSPVTLVDGGNKTFDAHTLVLEDVHA